MATVATKKPAERNGHVTTDRLRKSRKPRKAQRPRKPVKPTLYGVIGTEHVPFGKPKLVALTDDPDDYLGSIDQTDWHLVVAPCEPNEWVRQSDKWDWETIQTHLRHNETVYAVVETNFDRSRPRITNLMCKEKIDEYETVFEPSELINSRTFIIEVDQSLFFREFPSPVAKPTSS